MFCKQCGSSMADTARFCPKCGCAVTTTPTSAAVASTPDSTAVKTKKPVSSRKIGIAILCSIVGIVVLLLLVQLLDRTVFNTPNKLEDRLTGSVWYSNNSMQTTLMDGTKAITQERWEFHKDGTVTVETYMYYTYGEIPDNPEYELASTETYEWEVEDDLTLEIDDREYDFRSVLMVGDDKWEDAWGFQGDTLHMGRTYTTSASWYRN